MKKRILLIAFAITVFTISSVNGAGNPQTTLTGTIGPAISGEGSNVGGHDSKTWTLNVDGQQYSAYCIDPGAGLAGSVTCEMLTEGNYPMIYAAATDTNLSEDEKNAVFRTLGIMERQSNLYTSTGNIGEFNRNDLNVRFTASWHQALINYPGFDPGEMDPINKPYVDNNLAAALAPYVGLWVDKYWGSGASGGTSPTASAPATATSNSGAFTATQCGTNGDNPVFCVRGPANATDVNISGVNNTMISVDQEYSNGSAKFTVLSCKNAQVAISGVVPGGTGGGNNTPYLCTGSGSSQSYVAMMGGPSRDVLNLPVTCPPCPEQRDPLPERISPPADHDEIDASEIQGTGNIHLCCDNNISEIKEPELDGLFTGDNNIYYQLTNYSNKCNNNGFKDAGSGGLQQKLLAYVNQVKEHDSNGISGSDVSKYCNIYCVEEIKVDVPRAITSANGKYFSLTGSPDTSAKRKCRIKIDYRSIRAEYEIQVNGSETDRLYPGGSKKGEVKAYNEYQDHKAMFELLDTQKQPEYEKINTNVHMPQMEFYRDECVESFTAYKGDTGSTTSNGTKSCEEGGNIQTCNCTITPPATTCDCGTYYKTKRNDYSFPIPTCQIKIDVYELQTKGDFEVSCSGAASSMSGAGSCSKPYFQIKSYEDFPFDKGSFTGLKIEKADRQPRPHTYPQYTTEITDVTDCETKRDDTKDFYEDESHGGFTAKSYSVNWPSVTYNGSFFGSAAHCGQYSGGECPDTVRNREKSLAQTAQNDFNNAKGEAQKLESIAKGCEGFMAYDNTTYTLNPSGDFHYMQVYLNGQKEKTSEPQIIPFGRNSCPTRKSKIDEKTSTEIGGGGTEGEFKDVLDHKINWDQALKTSTFTLGNINDGVVTFERKVTEDYQYEVPSCKLPDPPAGNKYTLYPSPQVKDTVTGNRSTGHGHQYQLYLTTYQGSFQTYWDMDGLGLTQRTRDKFKQLFNQHGSTCAEQGSALSTGSAEALKESNQKVPFTCQLNVRLGGMRIGSCSNGVSASLPCENPKEINSLYEFKVVDPKNIFPQGTTYNGEVYARNWKTGENGDGGWGHTYYEIKSVADQDKTYAPEHLTYAFKLDATALNEIKKYNKSHSYEEFENLMSCTCSGDEDDGCGLIKTPGYPNPGGSCGGGTTWNTRCRKCLSNGFLLVAANGYWNNSRLSFSAVRGSSDVHWA